MPTTRATAVLALLAAAAAAVPVTVTETEPDGFTTPSPQALGSVGAGGLTVSGVLDPTSPTGLFPGDDDGFSFTMEADGPLRAVVDDGAGGIFVLALAEVTGSGTVLRAAVIGPAPLTLSRPALAAGTVFRVGVGAIGDGTPLAYTLDLDSVNAVPPWTGEPCTDTTAEAEPNDHVVSATDLGWFDRTLCGAGEIAVVSPVGSGIVGDTDTFRFRNVLPVPASLVISADPGTIDVGVDQLIFVGPDVAAAATFGSETRLGLPRLQPGADYMIRFSARSGAVPLHYSFFLEPVAPEPEAPPEPLDLSRTVLRLLPDVRRSRFALQGSFEEGLGTTLKDGTPVTLRVRGGESALASGKLRMDDLGRLRWKAPRGLDGIQSFFFDPYLGIVRIQGRGVDLAGTVDPANPAVSVNIDFGDLRLGVTENGVFSRNGRTLRVK